MLRLAVDQKATAGAREQRVSRKKKYRDRDFDSIPLSVCQGGSVVEWLGRRTCDSLSPVRLPVMTLPGYPTSGIGDHL